MESEDNRYNHKSWPTVPGPETLRIIDVLIADAVEAERKRIAESPVYMIQRIYRDADNRDAWETLEHLGFFLTQEEAEAKVNDLDWKDVYGDRFTWTEIDPGNPVTVEP